MQTLTAQTEILNALRHFQDQSFLEQHPDFYKKVSVNKDTAKFLLTTNKINDFVRISKKSLMREKLTKEEFSLLEITIKHQSRLAKFHS